MTFIRNLWYVAAWAEEIGENLLSRTILGEQILLYRDSAGRAIAIGNRCPHRFAPLSEGRRVEHDVVECPYHGLRFDGTGKCVFSPHEDGRIPRRAAVASYPLAEKYSVLWIWMGDPALADEASIPDFGQIDHPDYATVKGYTCIEANYELVADNLLDLSHTQFVHANFFEAPAVLKAKHEVSQEGGTVYSRRWVPATPAPNAFRRLLDNPDDLVDHWLRVRWNAPGLHRLDVGVVPHGDPEIPSSARREGSHLLTPETATSTHYFYANSRNYRIDSPEEDEKIREWHRIGFGEQDKPMIEKVQKMMGTPDLLSLNPVFLSIDTAAGRARRVMDLLREKEASASEAGPTERAMLATGTA